jgi:glycosyltransferase involved in cell wall biosynthesis
VTTRPITLAVNTLSVTEANEGIRTVLRSLLPALARVAPEIRQLLVCSRTNRSLFDPAADAIEVRVDHSRPVHRILADQLHVPLKIRGRADVLFTPSSVGTLFSPLPQVVFVQHHLALPSCQALAGPRSVSTAHRLYYGPVMRWSLRRADRVLANSQFVAAALVDELKIPAAKVAPMALGVTAPRPMDDPVARDPAVLFVGTLYEYKDAVVAVEAFAQARADLPSGAQLIVVGRDPDGTQAPLLRRAAERAGVAHVVDIRGSVTDEGLRLLYSRASALLMPSRCEGFGLPVLEAMSHGIPVIASDSTALTETTSGAGILVRPGDVEGFASALSAVFNDGQLRADLVAEGYRRAAAMTWDATAERLRRAVEAVAR